MIVPLNLPKANLKLTRKDEKVFVWSVVRKKDLLLTPEEWVRQHIIHFVIDACNFPLGRIAVEHRVEYNGRSKRADIVLFSREGLPRMIVECKAPEINIDDSTVFQIAQYNRILNVEFLLLSNGLKHQLLRISDDGIVECSSEIESIVSQLN